MLFNVSHVNRGIYQSLLVNARDMETAERYFREQKPESEFLGIHEATNDDRKPGKPVMWVPENYGLEKPHEEMGKRLGMKEFQAVVRKRGGVWDGKDVYFSGFRDSFQAAYLPKFPERSEKDSFIDYNWLKDEWKFGEPLAVTGGEQRNEKPMSLMEKLIEAGYPKEDFDHHCSDLYVYATPMTKQVIDDWFREQGMNRDLFVKPFRDNITGRAMYDVAFQYAPYWEEHCVGVPNKEAAYGGISDALDAFSEGQSHSGVTDGTVDALLLDAASRSRGDKPQRGEVDLVK